MRIQINEEKFYIGNKNLAKYNLNDCINKLIHKIGIFKNDIYIYNGSSRHNIKRDTFKECFYPLSECMFCIYDENALDIFINKICRSLICETGINIDVSNLKPYSLAFFDIENNKINIMMPKNFNNKDELESIVKWLQENKTIYSEIIKYFIKVV